MFTDRKLKKRLRKEADTLMQAKKEQMLSFYQPAEGKRARGQRIPVKRLIAASMAVLLLTVGIVAALLLSTDREGPDTEISVSSEPISPTASEASSGSGAFAMPLPWVPDLDTPHAILCVNEVLEDTVSLGEADFSVIRCETVFSYKTSDLTEIYMPKAFASELTGGMTFLIQVDRKNQDGTWYYFPVLTEDGEPEYFLFSEGKLVISDREKAFSSYELIEELNNVILFELKGGIYEDLLPAVVITDGCSVEEVQAYFEALGILRECYSWEQCIVGNN